MFYAAVVEYVVPAEARGAFKKLAYSKFKSLPLYLEYAPVNVFRYASDGSKIQVKKSEDGKETESTFAESGSTRKQKDTEEIELPNYEKDHEPIDENMVPEPETCLFVKNLDFGSTEDDLKKVSIQISLKFLQHRSSLQYIITFSALFTRWQNFCCHRRKEKRP